MRVPGAGAVTLFLRVDAPADAGLGERHTFQVLAAAVDEADKPARLDVEAVVGSEAPVAAPDRLPQAPHRKATPITH